MVRKESIKSDGDYDIEVFFPKSDYVNEFILNLKNYIINDSVYKSTINNCLFTDLRDNLIFDKCLDNNIINSVFINNSNSIIIF